MIEQVEAVLADVPYAACGEPSVFRILTHGAVHYLQVGDHFDTHDSDAHAIAGLITSLNRKSLDADFERLHIHAGAASMQGDAAMIVAASGGGKTTMLTSLVTNGWTYMSDEMVTLLPAEVKISCWPKPLSVKHRGLEMFGDIAGVDVQKGGAHRSAGLHISAGSLGYPVSTTAVPKLIAFLTTDSSSDEPQSLSPGSAVILLAEQTMDFERFGGESLMTLAQLSGSCRSLLLPRSDPKEMVSSLRTYWAREHRDPISPRSLVFGPGGGTADLEAVELGDEVIVRNTRSGRMAVLNDSGANTLNLLVSSDDNTREFELTFAEFREQLKVAGILSPEIGSN